ncbi:DUF7714 family protein [Pseudonocardia endophytica]|uniref:Uncharacterized protein n=1 Tax=Pseudonocardia endophytica TaxID=401976 RepID=A0A4R1I395_PSEEN|nr:hypothetical protein [Pseudonocardia endophytica]TCK24442.1 hypothetical protein EV378_0214 [Pseudonocardia endophytica]
MSATTTGPNVVPGRYRGVSVARVATGLDEVSLRAHFLGRDAYWKTRFVAVLPGDGSVALVGVDRDEPDALFAPITGVRLLAGPDECALVHDPECDTAIPSDLARAAGEHAPGARAVVVQGRYEHVNFILDPRPLAITVREVVPPHPAKLIDQARRMIAVTESWPPIRLEPEVVDLPGLAARHPAEHYLLPCRGGGAEIPGARLSYLDEHPDRADWTQLGCERSRQIHHAFYGTDAPRVDLCPRTSPASGPLLTKCCLQQEELTHGVEAGAPWVAVPWGSSLEVVRDALDLLVKEAYPTWSPA